MLEKYKDILSVKDMCEILNICSTTAYKLLNSNNVPNKKIGKKRFIVKDDFIKWINNKNSEIILEKKQPM